MDTANLIEEAERWARNVSESPGNGTAGEDLYGAKLLCDLAAALKASEERARKAEAMYRQRDADVTAWQRTATDLYTGNPPSEPSMAAGLKLMQEHMRQRDQAKACIQKAEQDRHALAVANLAANKRIVELEREAERLITQRDRWEEQVGDMAASAGCEEEFSNWHDHKDCVEECVTVLKTERDAARAELAQPSICPNCTAKLRRLDRMDAAGHAAYELDKARKDAAGQNKRAQKAEQEAKALRAELARLTTPRPIAEAPRDGTWVVIHWSKESHPVFRSLRWRIARYVSDCFVWVDERQEPLLEPSHYLPLPEVKP